MSIPEAWRWTGNPAESVNWWFKRSLIEEYQKAYDKIAEKITFDSGEILTDVACGTAEVIRRIPLRGKIIGTDSNFTILRRAKRNLKKNNIKSKIFTQQLSPQELQREVKKKKRVTLILDNMYKSSLPKNFSHKVVHTFPEYITFEHASDLMREDYEPKKISEMANERDKEIHRILKSNGIYYVADYEVLPSGEDLTQFQNIYLKKFGLNNLFRVIETEFIENAQIAKDAGLKKQYDIEGKKATSGYAIIIFEKI